MWPVTSNLPFMCLTMFLFVLGPKPGRADGVRVVVSVGSNTILPCSPSTKENLDYKRFQWMKDGQKQVFSYDGGIHSNNDRTGQDDQFKGRVSFFLDQLKSGDASIIIRNTQTADSGDYTCDLQSTGEKYIIHLVVVAAPKPDVSIDKFTESEVLLRCDVRGAFPIPDVRWQDSDGNVLHAEEPEVTERDGRYHITVYTTVTKTTTNNIITCVSEQKEISQRIESQIYVPEKPTDIGKVVGIVVAAVVIGVVGVGLAAVFYRKCNKKQEITLQQVEVQSGEPSVQLLFETTPDLPKEAKVKWMDSKDRIVHVYKNGSDQPDEQDLDYRTRTKMNENPLRTGDLSLTLKNPTEDDSGQYRCYVYRGGRLLTVESFLLTVTERGIKNMIEMKRRMGEMSLGTNVSSTSGYDMERVPQVEVKSGEESVLLPFKITSGLSEVKKVKWMDSKDRIVHVCYKDSDRPGIQALVYTNRTKMNENPLRTGDVSLTLKNPTEDDSGRYYCCVYRGDQQIRNLVLLIVTARVQVQDQTGDTRTTVEMTPLMGNQSV